MLSDQEQIYLKRRRAVLDTLRMTPAERVGLDIYQNSLLRMNLDMGLMGFDALTYGTAGCLYGVIATMPEVVETYGVLDFQNQTRQALAAIDQWLRLTRPDVVNWTCPHGGMSARPSAQQTCHCCTGHDEAMYRAEAMVRELEERQ